MSIVNHWQVTNRTYSGTQPGGAKPHNVTEFEFSNGVTLHYNPHTQEIDIFLPTRESYLSVGRSDQEVGDSQIGVTLSRTEGVISSITIHPGVYPQEG